MSSESFRNVVDALGWCLVHFLWQGAAVALLLWFGLAMARKARPQVRYAMAGVAMLAMLGWVVTTFFVEIEQRKLLEPGVVEVGGIHATGVAVEDSSEISASRIEGSFMEAKPVGSKLRSEIDFSRWIPLLVAVWAGGVAVLVMRLLGAWSAVRWLKRTGGLSDSEELGECFLRACRKAGVSRPIKILVSEFARVPMVIGWLKPVVLVPVGVLAGLSRDQLESVLVHELAHVRRHDYLVNLLQTMVEMLLFFHPVVWWVGAQLRKEREHCCDDIATEVCGDVLGYAEALAAVERGRGDERTPALGVAACDGSLLGRVRRLVRVEESRVSLWPLLVIFAALIGGLFGTSGAGAADEENVEVVESDAEVPAENRGLVKVQVVDGENWEPIGGAEIGYILNGEVFTTVADASGEALVPGRRVGRRLLHLKSDRYLSRFRSRSLNGSFEFSRVEVEELDPQVLVAVTGEKVEGRVVDSEGRSVVGAKVKVEARFDDLKIAKHLGIKMDGPAHLANWSNEATTDNDGRYRIMVPKEDMTAWGRTTCGRNEIEGTGGEIMLPRRVTVRGQILGAKGRSVARLKFYLGLKGNLAGSMDTLSSDLDGEFKELRLKAGTYSVMTPRVGPGHDMKVKSIAHLPPPFLGFDLVVPDIGEGEIHEFTVSPVEGRLVRFDVSGHLRPGWPNPVAFISGQVKGRHWSSPLYEVAKIGQLCAIVPKELTEAAVMPVAMSPIVYSLIPSGGGNSVVGSVPIELGDGDQVFGTILGEKAASLVVNFKGLKGKFLNDKDFTVTAYGRFGKRQLTGQISAHGINVWGVYPGESVEYSVDHPKIKKVGGEELALKAGEVRYSHFLELELR